jgi:hypothetical protein
MLKKFCSSILALLFFACAHLHADCKQILNYIFENLPEYGTLVQDSEGFVYVDIPNDYIYKLFPLIDQKNFVLPPYFGRPGLHGAHISVIYASEAKENGIKIKEQGQTIYFYPKVCQIVKPGKWKEVDEVYTITVEAPALNKLRKRYGLRDAAYPFHITIGVKYSNVEQEDGLLEAG